MFENVGSKLQRAAVANLIIGIIGSFGGGVLLLGVIGMAVIVGGIIATLFSSWLLYAVGEIADRTNALKKELAQIKSASQKELAYAHSDDPVEDATNKWKAQQAQKENQ